LQRRTRLAIFETAMSVRIVTHVPPENPQKGYVEQAVREAVADLGAPEDPSTEVVLGDSPGHPSFVPPESGISIRVVATNCLRAGRIAPEASPRDIDLLVRHLVFG
jgi:hypothetical protein